jgi:transcriptional regulator with XRE-family HTH domain
MVIDIYYNDPMSFASSIQPYGRYAQREQFRAALGNEITALRLAKGLRACECAKAAGISPQSWYAYESGQTMPSAWMLCLLADVLGSSVDALRPSKENARRVARAKKAPDRDCRLTSNERWCLKRLIRFVPELETGAKFRLQEILPTGPRYAWAIRQRIRQLEHKGILVYEAGGYLRLAKTLQRAQNCYA